MIRIIDCRERRRIRRQSRQRKDHNNIEDVRIIAVLEMVAMNPHVSTRQIQSELGIPRNTASRLLRSLKYHPYHVTSLVIRKVLNENELHYSVLKSFCYQLLDSRIKNMMFHLKKSM